jgi:hypothetical protein
MRRQPKRDGLTGNRRRGDEGEMKEIEWLHVQRNLGTFRWHHLQSRASGALNSVRSRPRYRQHITGSRKRQYSTTGRIECGQPERMQITQ